MGEEYINLANHDGHTRPRTQDDNTHAQHPNTTKKTPTSDVATAKTSCFEQVNNPASHLPCNI
jgi:hypothetical protein